MLAGENREVISIFFLEEEKIETFGQNIYPCGGITT